MEIVSSVSWTRCSSRRRGCVLPTPFDAGSGAGLTPGTPSSDRRAANRQDLMVSGVRANGGARGGDSTRNRRRSSVAHQSTSVESCRYG